VSGKDYSIINKIQLPPCVDGAVFNPIDKNYYVEGGVRIQRGYALIHIIDTKTFKLVGNFAAGKSFRSNGHHSRRQKTLCELGGPKEVGVVDWRRAKTDCGLPIPDAEVPNSMVLDEPNHRCSSPRASRQSFSVFNIDTGKVVTTLPCNGINDDMSFDVPHKRIYVTGTDYNAVFEQRDATITTHREVPTGISRKDIPF